jgi:subtilisin family serine protease
MAVQLRGAPSARYSARRGYGPSPAVERTLNQLAKEHGLMRVEGWLIGSLDAYCEVFAVADGVDIDKLLATLNEDPRVELAQRMNVFETLVGHYDDPYADLQEAVIELEIEPAHELATGSGVTVAVIDSGIDERHPDLRGRVAISRDFVERGAGIPDGEIHGTAVAGIIGSQVNNNVGIVGVAPDVRIAALRACWAMSVNTTTAHCSSFSLALAVETAMRFEAQVINLSVIGPFDPLLAELLDEALRRGIVIVAAAPEATEAADTFPASHAGVIAARSASIDAELPPYTLPAPAREILTTTPNAGYAFLSGNSLAAAHVSGVIALLLERAPAIDAVRLVRLLSESAHQEARVQSISACRALVRLMGTGLCGNDVGEALSREARVNLQTETGTTR